MIIDYKKILETNIDYFKKYYQIDTKDELGRQFNHLNTNIGDHYRLLTYISYLYNDITILDIGTRDGESCLALAQNKKNKVITYDINKVNLPYMNDYKNIEFKVMDINQENMDVINSAKIIFFDIGHEGKDEKIFSDNLEKIGYKGYVFCDDVFSKIYPECTKWFDKLQVEKYNISEIGHFHPIFGHGTGLLNYYNDKSVEIIKTLDFNILDYYNIPFYKKALLTFKYALPVPIRKVLKKLFSFLRPV